MNLNLAQRAVLTLMLAVDGLFCVYPPFARVHRHHWLFWHDRFRGFFPYPIDIWRLALEIFIVTLIGATAVVLARVVPDSRMELWLRRLRTWEARTAILISAFLIGMALLVFWGQPQRPAPAAPGPYGSPFHDPDIPAMLRKALPQPPLTRGPGTATDVPYDPVAEGQKARLRALFDAAGLKDARSHAAAPAEPGAISLCPPPWHMTVWNGCQR